MSVVTEIEPRTVRAHLTLTKGSREEASVFVHPGLKVGLDPAKGRKVVPTRLLKDGETLLIDSPYALVPAMMADDPPYYLCSWNECNRRIQPQTKAVNCPDHCVEEVMWCNEQCRQNDRNRHNLECSWLKRFSSDIRSKHGDSDFGVLWLVARILIHRHIDVQMNRCGRIVGKGNQELAHLHLRGWDSVRSLDGNPKGFRAELVEQWKLLAQSYLAGIALDIEVDTQDALDLFCKLESNSFGLYPGVTGEYPVVSFVSRGGYYGAGIYPTAAMFNHSCCPNIIHKLDENGRRIFEANRDIEEGEECCISYFDLTEFSDTQARQEEMKRSWNFMCNCQRCTDEGDYEMPHFLKEMDF